MIFFECRKTFDEIEVELELRENRAMIWQFQEVVTVIGELLEGFLIFGVVEDAVRPTRDACGVIGIIKLQEFVGRREQDFALLEYRGYPSDLAFDYQLIVIDQNFVHVLLHGMRDRT